VRVGLKWPNDLYVDGRKLGGILIETRWRHARPDWIAVGIGINVRAPGLATATGLPDTVDRVTVLSAVVAAVRRAVGASGGLTTTELDAWSARDIAVGRECREPALGTVHGIDVDGALVVRTAAGLATFRAGSLVLTDGTA
jgi:BirA family biotin operon repressor/biotin-[acetyl-CoA-carboxylase] ligase